MDAPISLDYNEDLSTGDIIGIALGSIAGTLLLAIIIGQIVESNKPKRGQRRRRRKR